MALQNDPALPPAYDALQVGIAVYDATEATVASANDRLESIFGYRTEELSELSVETYTANTYTFTAADFVGRLRDAVEAGPQEFVWRLKRSDGELAWVRVHFSRFPDDEREYVLAEVRDITDYYVASRREALFWRILRHNLRNETNKIAGYVERVRDLADDEEATEAAERALSTAIELGTIATSVKQIQHAATRCEANRSYRRAVEPLRDVVEAVEAEYPDAEIRLHEREAMWIHVDAAFEYACRHAVQNAVVHSTESTPAVRVTVGPSPNTGRVEIRIVDSNPPIPDVEIDVLDEFTELTSTSHGTGVGLFVMKWCIESLGGELQVERREPRGNVVHFYLPPKERPT
ncbi:ATP-binding protein [Halobellus rarus]|uniref:ATP-binding protein n=1 Tax=Halobellus rarus TaxID=1126237 RepID=UPI002112FE6D|nr:ATP-binding protein [Halobellus rarus]